VSGKARDARRAVRPPADVDALLSPEEVARRFGLSRRAVYRAIERGELRASRLCSRIRIRAADVEAWVEENQIEPASIVTRPSLPSPLLSSADSGRQSGLRREPGMSTPWLEALREERAAQLASYPRPQTLVQAHVEQAVAERVEPSRAWLTLPEAAGRLVVGIEELTSSRRRSA